MQDNKLRNTNFDVCSILIKEVASASKNKVSTFYVYRKYSSERKKVLIKVAYFPMDFKMRGILMINDPLNKDIPLVDRKTVLEDFLNFYHISKADSNYNSNIYYSSLISIRKFLVFCLVLEIDYKKCFHDGYVYPCNLTEREFLQILFRFFRKDSKIFSSDNKIELNLISHRQPNSRTLLYRFKHIESFLKNLGVYTEEELGKIHDLLKRNIQAPKRNNQLDNGSGKYLTVKELQLISSEIETYKIDSFDNLKMINPLKTNITSKDWVQQKKYFDTKLLFTIMLCCAFRTGTMLSLTREDLKSIMISSATGEYAYAITPHDRIGNPADSRIKNAPKPLVEADYDSKKFQKDPSKCSAIYIPEWIYRFILDYELFLEKYYKFRLKKSRRKKELMSNYNSLNADCIERHNKPFDNKFIFFNNNFTKMSADTARKYFIEIFKKVGIAVDHDSKRDNNLLHRFRHTRMQIAISEGQVTNFEEASRILGNSVRSISGSETYIHLKDVEDCRDFVEVLEKNKIFVNDN